MKDRVQKEKNPAGPRESKLNPDLDPEVLRVAQTLPGYLEAIQGHQRADEVLRMQRTIGNRAVQRQVAPVQRIDLGGIFGGGGGGIMDTLGGLLGGGGGGLGGMLSGLLGGGGGGLGGMLSGLLGGGGGGLGGMLSGLLGGGGGGIGGMLSGLMGGAGGAVSGLAERGRNLLGGLFG